MEYFRSKHIFGISSNNTNWVEPQMNPRMKHLMRSQALRESTSPPRISTDTVPAMIANDDTTSTTVPENVGSIITQQVQDNISTKSPLNDEFPHHTSGVKAPINNPSSAGIDGIISEPVFLDLDFPKLAYSKSKVVRAQIMHECGSSTDNGKNYLYIYKCLILFNTYISICTTNLKRNLTCLSWLRLVQTIHWHN